MRQYTWSIEHSARNFLEVNSCPIPSQNENTKNLPCGEDTMIHCGGVAI